MYLCDLICGEKKIKIITCGYNLTTQTYKFTQCACIPMNLCDESSCEHMIKINLSHLNPITQAFEFTQYVCIPINRLSSTSQMLPWNHSHVANLSRYKNKNIQALLLTSPPVSQMVPWNHSHVANLSRSENKNIQGSIESVYSENILIPDKNNYNAKQILVVKIYKKLEREFIKRKKLVKKIDIDENCLALRLFGNSAKHIESLSSLLFHFDNEIVMQELSIYLNRRKNDYIKGITAYVKFGNKNEKENIFDICKQYDLKVTFLGDSNNKKLSEG